LVCAWALPTMPVHAPAAKPAMRAALMRVVLILLAPSDQLKKRSLHLRLEIAGGV
jgi:hypothetical protein